MAKRIIALPLGVAGAMLAGAALGQSITVVGSEDSRLSLGSVSFEGGRTLELSHGIGNAGFRRADQPDGEFILVSDRGPNFTCGDAEDVAGIGGNVLCGEVNQGRIYPKPDYSPSIYRVRVDANAFELIEVIPLKDGEGRLINGLPNKLTVASTETPVDSRGRPLERSANAIDAEGIVQLRDGSFWIGEENAPSILHVQADGTIDLRVVPEGTKQDFAEAGYKVVGGLPAILAERQANRGIESMALSPDERSLWFVLQNPLANPDGKAFQQARSTRLFQFDLQSGQIIGEYVYELTEMARFPGEESKNPGTARVSELLAIDHHRFLIDDRTDKTTLLFEIDVTGATDIAGTTWDDPATSPTLEEVNLAGHGIKPAAKRLVLDSSKHPELPGKIEGMAWFANCDLMLINDNDFGITGELTRIARLTGLEIRP
jgi:hypothetical protein